MSVRIMKQSVAGRRRWHTYLVRQWMKPKQSGHARSLAPREWMVERRESRVFIGAEEQNKVVGREVRRRENVIKKEMRRALA